MTQTRFICSALGTLVALVALSTTATSFADEGKPAPSSPDSGTSAGAPAPATGEKGSPAQDKALEGIPEEQHEAVKQAIEGAEGGEGTTVIVVPPPPPKVREYEPSRETDQEAEAEERVPGGQLHPKGEDAMMADHPVDRGDIKFRPGKGVEINSADDNFQLRIRVRVQMLYTIIHGDIGSNDAADATNKTLNDFRLRRARFVFQGHAFGKYNQYKLEIDPLRKDNVVLDYYLDFTKNRDIQVRVGQYKLSSNQERVISSGNLQMVDRSRINSEFSLDRDMGIDIRSRDFLGKNKMRYVLGVSMGNGLNNFQVTNFGMVYLARIEYLPLGIFRDYSEVDFARTKPRLSIGATYSFFNKAERDRGMVGKPFADGGTADYHFVYVDAVFKAWGFSALSSLAFRTGTRQVGDITMDPDGNPIEPTAPRNGLGWMLQAGYLLPHTHFELAGRGAIIHALRGPTSLSDSYGVTFSTSWYFARHPFKIQADVSQIWEDTFHDGITTFRMQLQASL